MAMSVLPEKIYGGGKLIAGSLEIKYKNKQSIKMLLDIYRQKNSKSARNKNYTDGKFLGLKNKKNKPS